jgi:hypothetical protein
MGRISRLKSTLLVSPFEVPPGQIEMPVAAKARRADPFRLQAEKMTLQIFIRAVPIS